MRSTVLLLALLISIAVAPGSASVQTRRAADVGEAPSSCLKLTAFAPTTPGAGEYVVLSNAKKGTCTGTWSLTDGEGTLTIAADVVEGGRLILQRGNVSGWERPSLKDIIIDIDDLPRTGRFALADTGDEVTLRTLSGEGVDTVVYGDGVSTPGWSGAGVPFVGVGFAPGRHGMKDTDTASDWDPLRRLGARVTYPDASGRVKVYALPDSGEGAIREFIEGASQTLDIAVYTLSGEVMLDAVSRALMRGVRVRILIEGSPVGGVSTGSALVLNALRGRGADVRVPDGFYRFHHEKYMLSDGSNALISTDNFGPRSFNRMMRCCDRGIVLTASSPEVASGLLQVFMSDWANATPYTPPSGIGGGARSGIDGRYAPMHRTSVSGRDARISLHISPEMGPGAVVGALSHARERILLWLSETGTNASIRGVLWTNPLFQSLADAWQRGVEVRILTPRGRVDALRSWFDAQDVPIPVHESMNGLEPHAKVALIDGGLSVISSMNWVFNSMYRNREVGVLVHDANVTAYLAEVFERDWSGDIGDPVARIEAPASAHAGEPIHLSGRSSLDDSGISAYLWEADGKTISREMETIHTFTTTGNHTVLLKVWDGLGNTNITRVIISVSPSASFEPERVSGPGWVLASVLVSAVLLSAARMCRRGGVPTRGLPTRTWANGLGSRRTGGVRRRPGA